MDQTQAASSPAEVDVFNGQQPTMAEYNSYRESGELPEKFKPAETVDSATTDAPEETVEAEEPESDPDAEEAQEQPQKVSPAEKRIKQLLAETKELKRKLEAAKPTQPDSSTAQAQQTQAPQNFDEWVSRFNPSQWVEDYAKANPKATYEEANLKMAVFVGKAQKHFDTIEARVNAEKQALEARVSEARERYDNFDEIKESFLDKVLVKHPNGSVTPAIPLQVLGIINDSEVMAHLLYTIGSDEAELAKFVDMAKREPNKAIRYVTKVESLIAEELAKPKTTTARGEDGKFAAPEQKKTTAPKPPSPVGGGSSRGFDVNDETLSADEWHRKRNAELARK